MQPRGNVRMIHGSKHLNLPVYILPDPLSTNILSLLTTTHTNPIAMFLLPISTLAICTGPVESGDVLRYKMWKHVEECAKSRFQKNSQQFPFRNSFRCATRVMFFSKSDWDGWWWLLCDWIIISDMYPCATHFRLEIGHGQYAFPEPFAKFWWNIIWDTWCSADEAHEQCRSSRPKRLQSQCTIKPYLYPLKSNKQLYLNCMLVVYLCRLADLSPRVETTFEISKNPFPACLVNTSGPWWCESANPENVLQWKGAWFPQDLPSCSECDSSWYISSLAFEHFPSLKRQIIRHKKNVQSRNQVYAAIKSFIQLRPLRSHIVCCQSYSKPKHLAACHSHNCKCQHMERASRENEQSFLLLVCCHNHNHPGRHLQPSDGSNSNVSKHVRRQQIYHYSMSLSLLLSSLLTYGSLRCIHDICHIDSAVPSTKSSSLLHLAEVLDSLHGSHGLQLPILSRAWLHQMRKVVQCFCVCWRSDLLL